MHITPTLTCAWKKRVKITLLYKDTSIKIKYETNAFIHLGDFVIFHFFLYRLGYKIKGSKWHKIGNAVDTCKMSLILIIRKHTHTRRSWHSLYRCAYGKWHTCTHTWIAICFTITIITKTKLYILLLECASYVANGFWVAWKIERKWKKKLRCEWGKNGVFSWV